MGAIFLITSAAFIGFIVNVCIFGASVEHALTLFAGIVIGAAAYKFLE